MILPQKITKNSLTTVLRRCFIAILAVLTTVAVANAQFPDDTDDINWLIEVLELEGGSVVADIGAGEGDQTLAIADYVGSEGHVYSSELGSNSIEELREAIEETKASNVTVVEGHPARTNLPEECCDALFLRRVYHHFGDPPSINKSMLHSLKPGGRLAVIDFEPRGDEADPGGRASGSQHGVTAETVVEELTQAGFKLISSEQRSGRSIYVVMQKPEKE